MRKELITDEELWEKLREAEVESLDDVKEAYIEPDGQISVIKKGKRGVPKACQAVNLLQ